MIWNLHCDTMVALATKLLAMVEVSSGAQSGKVRVLLRVLAKGKAKQSFCNC